MLIEDQHPLNKSILVGVLGMPNVGKSSLINQIIEFDLSVVTRLPQTTRNHFHCSTVIGRTEMIFVDTPGIHNSTQELNKRMVGQAKDGVTGTDINLFLVDLTQNNLEQQKQLFVETFPYYQSPTWIVFTKSDLLKNVKQDELMKIVAEFKELFPTVEMENFFFVSSREEAGKELLLKALMKRAPSAPHLYPDGDVSNKSERFFVTEYVREQAFLNLKEELPYELAVVIDEYKTVRGEDGPTMTHISASILVNRTSQRAIVIGSKGQMIKDIGTKARRKIEAMVGHQVHLNLHVKVLPKWAKNNFVLEELGLQRVQDSTRVWRKK